MPKDIYPSFRYRDARTAIDWLERAFGFERQVVYDDDRGGVAHAELRYGDGLVMLGSEREGDDTGGRHLGRGWAYVAVDDLAAHYEQAKASGAEIERERQDEDYGSFYGARDLEGNHWSFGTYRPARAEG